MCISHPLHRKTDFSLTEHTCSENFVLSRIQNSDGMDRSSIGPLSFLFTALVHTIAKLGHVLTPFGVGWMQGNNLGGFKEHLAL